MRKGTYHHKQTAKGTGEPVHQYSLTKAIAIHTQYMGLQEASEV